MPSLQSNTNSGWDSILVGGGRSALKDQKNKTHILLNNVMNTRVLGFVFIILQYPKY
jgi:hypothetical protein